MLSCFYCKTGFGQDFASFYDTDHGDSIFVTIQRKKNMETSCSLSSFYFLIGQDALKLVQDCRLCQCNGYCSKEKKKRRDKTIVSAA